MEQMPVLTDRQADSSALMATSLNVHNPKPKATETPVAVSHGVTLGHF